MTEEIIAEKASEFEYTDGIYGFKQGVKWVMQHYNLKDDDTSGVSVDLNTYTVSNNGKLLKLPTKVVKLIHYFIMNKNKVITRQELISNMWHKDVVVGERTVDVHIRKIKIALGNSKCIQTYKGVGYKWVL